MHYLVIICLTLLFIRLFDYYLLNINYMVIIWLTLLLMHYMIIICLTLIIWLLFGIHYYKCIIRILFA